MFGRYAIHSYADAVANMLRRVCHYDSYGYVFREAKVELKNSYINHFVLFFSDTTEQLLEDSE
ncbi:Uncharacterised protein [Serratia proteamaculans]|nr:Uncharacterised protein [Serratia proteamaculans]CAI1625475.1 Uncharacterised protein [Serratia proteamaculans]